MKIKAGTEKFAPLPIDEFQRIGVQALNYFANDFKIFIKGSLRALDNLEIEFSNEMPIRFYSYSSLAITLNSIYNEIMNKVEMNKKNNIDGRVINFIKDSFAPHLKSESIYSLPVLGDYSFKRFTTTNNVLPKSGIECGHIVLYVKQIEKNKGKLSFKEKIKEVFVHQLFHWIHHVYTAYAFNYGSFHFEIDLRNDYSAAVVIESLADFFTFYFSSKEGIDSEILKVAQSHDILSYPNSGMLYINKDNFQSIFYTSCLGMDKALFMILVPQHFDDYYRIKNKN